MSALSDLSPDQRAVLQLLLKQDKTYGELASLLRIDPGAVRERATMGLDALAGPAGDGLSDAEVDRLADFLLGQDDAEPPRDDLAVAWSRAVSAALRDGGLEPKAELAAAEPASVPGFAPEGAGAGETHSSRLGGLILLLGIVAVVAVVLVVVLTRGGDDESTDTTPVAAQTAAGDTATTTSPTSTTTTPLSVEAQINMTPASRSSKALGVATIITDGKTQAVQLQTQGLAANGKSDLYALWLTGGAGGKASLLGFQKTPVDKTGRFQGTASLPTDAADYKYIQLSRETADDPTKPSNSILRGALK